MEPLTYKDYKMKQTSFKKVMDDEYPALKRFKILNNFTESSGENEIHAFYQNNYSVVHKIFLDSLQQLDHGAKSAKTKGKPIPTSDVLNLCNIMKHLFLHVRNIIEKKWQIRSITHNLECFLDARNAHQIRKTAYQLLVQFIDILQDKCDAKLINLLLSAVDFTAFANQQQQGDNNNNNSSVRLPTFEIREISDAERLMLATRASPHNTEEESLQLLKIFFEAFQKEDTFDFWWNFFKARLAPILYPRECQELGLSESDDIGFRDRCPYRIHIYVLEMLLESLAHPRKSHNVLYATDLDINLVLMIFRQSFATLPPTEYDHLNAMLKVYRSWILHSTSNNPPPPPPQQQQQRSNALTTTTITSSYSWPSVMEENRTMFIRIFIDHLSQVLYLAPTKVVGALTNSTATTTITMVTSNSGTPIMDLMIDMANQVLWMFKYLSSRFRYLNDNEIRNDVLMTYIGVLDNVLSYANSMDPAKQEYYTALQKPLAKNLFIVWLRAEPDKSSDARLWNEFSKVVQKHFACPDLLRNWRVTTVNMTKILISLVFRLDLEYLGDLFPYEADAWGPYGSGSNVASGSKKGKQQQQQQQQQQQHSSSADLSASPITSTTTSTISTTTTAATATTASTATTTITTTTTTTSTSSGANGSGNGSGSGGSASSFAAAAATTTTAVNGGSGDGIDGHHHHHSNNNSNNTNNRPYVELNDDLMLHLEENTVLHLWHKLIEVYGNDNVTHRSGELHTAKIRVIGEVIDEFLKISHIQVKVPKGMRVPDFVHSPEGNTLMQLFGQWLLEACYRTDPDFVDGRCVAYVSLCRIFAHKSAQPMHLEYLAEFYRAVYFGLSTSSLLVNQQPNKVIESIVVNSSRLLSMNHKSVSVLIPVFVKTAYTYLLLDGVRVPRSMRVACLSIIGSCMGYCYHATDLEFPKIHIDTYASSSSSSSQQQQRGGSGGASASATSAPTHTGRTSSADEAASPSALTPAPGSGSGGGSRLSARFKSSPASTTMPQSSASSPSPSASSVGASPSPSSPAPIQHHQHHQPAQTTNTSTTTTTSSSSNNAPSSTLQSMSAVNYLSTRDLRLQLTQILVDASGDTTYEECQVISIWLLFDHAVFELLSDKPSLAAVVKAIETILGFLRHKNDAVALAAVDSIVAFAHLNLFSFLTLDLARMIISRLCHNIIYQISVEKNIRGSIRDDLVASLYYCLVDVIINAPLSAIEDTAVSNVLFDAISLGLVGECAQKYEFETSSSSNTYDSPSTKTEGGGGGIRTPRISGLRGFGSVRGHHHKLLGGGGDGKNAHGQHGHGHGGQGSGAALLEELSPQVIEAAESLLAHLMNTANHYPIPNGPSQISSDINEYDDLQLDAPTATGGGDKDDGGGSSSSSTPLSKSNHHFVFNDSTLMTFIERKISEEEAVARIILRDMTGKYCWETRLVYNKDQMTYKPINAAAAAAAAAASIDPNNPNDGDNVNNNNNNTNDDTANGDGQQQQQQHGRTPSSGDDDDDGSGRASSVDKALLDADTDPTADDAMTVITSASVLEGVVGESGVDTPHSLTNYPCFSPHINFDKVDMLESLTQYVHSTHPDLRRFIENTLSAEAERDTSHTFMQDRILAHLAMEQAHLERKIPQLSPSPAPVPVPANNGFYMTFRAFLSNMGLLTDANRQGFARLDANARFYRALKQLDKVPERETIKVGVIYVKNGQEMQKSLLRNSSSSAGCGGTSALYEEFLAGLGWNVNLATHGGFLGGLDPYFTTGTEAPYWANSTMEMIFHVVTKMPTNENDEQQIHKKRHVGNDIVHIVWSEHDRDYRPWTIVSQFNFVHIVVYPLDNGLFRIQIHTKEELQPLFGPLIDGIMVTKRVLAPLVRQTAIHANRAVRYKEKGYKRPYPTRRDQIDEIVQRFKLVTSTNEDFWLPLFDLPTSSPSPSSSSSSTTTTTTTMTTATATSD